MKRNVSTKDTEKRKAKKTNRRSQAKYPALQRKFTLRTRQDYIDCDYVNGVVNDKGEQVIRALNAEEKEFLNGFYEEYLGANFLHDTDLRKIHNEIKELKYKDNLSEDELIRLDQLQMEYCMVADEVLLYPNHEDQKKLYGENNARNRCIFNRTKSIGCLDELNEGVYDEIHKAVYNNPKVGENLIINTLEPKLNKPILRKKSKDNSEASESQE